jgi:serine O-acetyltransferase
MSGVTTAHRQRFVQDIARWIRAGEIADASEVTWSVALRLLYRHLPLRAVGWFRLGSWFKERNVPMVPGLIQRRLLKVYGLELAPGNDIGGGLYIVHPVGCTVFVDHLGENASIIAAVTVGNRGGRDWPKIGDNVFMGAGARVLGGITLGDDVNVGANAVVLHDVPSGCTAVGIPARILQRSDNGAGSAPRVPRR